MRRLFAIVFGVILGGGLVYASFQYHLVRTGSGFLLVPKRQAGLRDAYADVRQWTHHDWNEHRELVRNLIASGHGDIVSSSAAEGLLHDVFGGL